MLSALSLLASSAILFYIIKYRVHVKIEMSYTRPSSRNRSARMEAPNRAIARPQETGTSAHVARRDTTKAKAESNAPGSIVWGDITSALINLGAPKPRAEAAARRACDELPNADFNARFRAAVQYCGKAA